MKFSKYMTFCLITLLIIPVLSSYVLSIGVRGSPVVTKMFVPGQEFELEYEAISNMDAPREVTFSIEPPQGEWGSATITPKKVRLNPKERAPFRVTVKLADNAPAKPGPYYIRAGAHEVPPEMRGGTIGSATTVKMIIIVFVPYPEKYIDAKLQIPGVAQGETVKMDLILSNYGNQAIESAEAVVNVYDDNGNKIATVPAYEPGNKNDFEISIPYRKNSKMYADWDPPAGLKGLFRAEALVTYDGKHTATNGTIKIGYRNISIINITNRYTIGKVEEFHVYAQSIWNNELKDVQAEVVFYNSTNNLDSVRTPSQTIEAFGLKKMKGFFNVRNFYSAGNYSANVTVFFYDNQGERVSVSKVFPVEFAKEVKVESPFKFFSGNMLLTALGLIVILLIIGANLFFFFLIKKKRSDKDDEGKGSSAKKKFKKSKTKPKSKSKKKQEELEASAEEELKALEEIDLD